jgi:hypothetical protein
LIKIGKNVNNPNTMRLGATNNHAILEPPKTRCAALNKGSKALKAKAKSLARKV